MNDKLIEKIQKLMSKAESTNNEAEASAFMMKAQELMAKNEIDMDKVTIKSKGQEVESETIMEGAKSTAKRFLILAVIIGKNFKVKPLVCGTSIVFYGFKEDIKVAKIIFTSAANFIIRRRQQVYREARKNGEDTKGLRESWEMGFLKGLEDSFKKNVEEKGLMVITPQAVVEKVEELAPTKRRTGGKVNNNSLYEKGLKEGMMFNKGIEG